MTDPISEYCIFFSHKTNNEIVTKLIMDLLDRHTEGIKYFATAGQVDQGHDQRHGKR